MKASVRVGDVEVAVTGLKLTMKDLRSLMRAAASIAVALTPEPPEPAPPIGFAAPVLERLPDTDIAPEPE